MFKKILIANRGEIAVRVIRACEALGVKSVAIFSEADEDALHRRFADEAVCCGPARATESYLDIGGIVEIAKSVGADAIHPGYGFLSENAEFAEAVAAAGIALIGPTPEVIRSMGLKIAARERMIAAGVPVVPGGVAALTDVAVARAAAEEIGYPVLVKASAGGGGRGMRRVDSEAELEAALERAASEAEAAFGDGAVYLEKFVLGPRHIEIQIMADAHGRTLHFGERECSVQRRHQKLIEEAPAYGMTEATRAAMGAAAVRAAEAVDYVGAGTVEFLMDSAGAFYFLEMNTRIQVEHPVTECVTGVDLVALQIRVAAGEAIPFGQEDVRLAGHAIEARVYAEDPDKGFIPSPGAISGWIDPSGEGVRLDAGFEGGQTVTPHYDPMIAKLIVSGRDREEALSRMSVALDEFWIAGIRTGLPFLRRCLANDVFCKGAYDTAFIEDEMSDELPELAPALRDLVYGLAAWRASKEGGDEGATWRVGLKKKDSVDVRVSEESGQVAMRVDGRDMSCGLNEIASDVFEVVSAARLEGGEKTRVSISPKKNGAFDLGLLDRVIRLKVSAA